MRKLKNYLTLILGIVLNVLRLISPFNIKISRPLQLVVSFATMLVLTLLLGTVFSHGKVAVSQVDASTLTVRTYLFSELAADGRGAPAGPGVIIRVDSKEVGKTGAGGTAKLQVPAGQHLIETVLYPSSYGQATVTLTAGKAKQVDIILDDSKEPTENTILTLDQLKDGVLARNFTTFTMRFLNGQQTVPLRKLEEVELLDPNGGSSLDLKNLFVLQTNGSIVATNVNALRNVLLSRSGAIEIDCLGYDATGRTHANVLRIYLSSYRVVGTLKPPPSFPSLQVSGLYIRANILNTNLSFYAVSDSTGRFEFPLLPSGTLEFTSQNKQNGKYYYGQGTVVLNGDILLTVNMLSDVDLGNGVPGFTSAPLPSSFLPSSAGSPTRSSASASRRMQQESLRNSFPPVGTLDTSNLASVSVVAGVQNSPISQTVTAVVPKGTKTLTLTYNVSTDEYPTYVLSQSIYNDVWSIRVTGGSEGKQLFNITRQINSQLSTPPVWQSNGSTGQIQQEFNVESLTVNSDANFTLFASATNVGDSILPTQVSASLGGKSLKIDSITPDMVVPTIGDSSFYSIPRVGGTNTFQRFFILKVTKPENSQVTQVVETLLDQSGNSLMEIVNQAPGGPNSNVQEVNDSTLRVRATLNNQPSVVASEPPVTHLLKYRFKVVAKVNGGTAQDEKDSGNRKGLWRMPNNFARYGGRDQGGDDWCSRGAFKWLEANRALITRIDDISGEHARNIGHPSSHRYGTDIDMYHFYTFPNATSGTDNYNRLAADVRLAAQGNGEARNRVVAWVNATRTGLRALAALPTVNRLLYAIGSAGGGLPEGWARALIQSGATTVNGQNFNLGLTTWSEAKVTYNAVHNNHVHIALNRAAIGEGG